MSEKVFVAGEQVMFPEMLAKPCAAGGPRAVYIVDRGGAAPEVGVVMGDPAAAAVLSCRGACAADGEVIDQVKQRFMAFAQVARFRGPVIHFAIDVERPFAF